MRVSHSLTVVVGLLLAIPCNVSAQICDIMVESVSNSCNCSAEPDRLLAGNTHQLVLTAVVKCAEATASNYNLGHAFKIHSPDGASTSSIQANFHPNYPSGLSISDINHWHKVGGSGNWVFSDPGPVSIGPLDTLGIVVSGLGWTGGLKPGDSIGMWYVDFATDAADIGRHICIDSTYEPPSGGWEWVQQSGGSQTIYPEWNNGTGEICYEIVSDCGAVTGDDDHDLLCDWEDNCPEVYNPGQEDTDDDGIGDICDLWWDADDGVDSDGDGVPDDYDLCPGYDDYQDEDNNHTPDGCETGCIDDGTGPDDDSDGWTPAPGGCDCDDFNPSIHPGAEEYCDARDNNCDGIVDGVLSVNMVEWYGDGDGDGYGSVLVTRACTPPPGTVSNNDDCADWDASINPDAVEVECNGIDENCDGFDGYDCTFDQSTPAGLDVSVELAECTVTFTDVSSVGVTSMDRTQTGPEGASFAVLPLSNPVYNNITTTAGFSGVIEVCISYSELYLYESIPEADLKLMHYTGATWEDATTYHDMENNIICGEVTSLSPFAIAIPTGCCEGRVGDANGLGGDEPTIGDASAMIDAKFIAGTCVGILECLTEADINQTGGGDPTCDDITIGDISILIDYLFITGPTLGLPACL